MNALDCTSISSSSFGVQSASCPQHWGGPSGRQKEPPPFGSWQTLGWGNFRHTRVNSEVGIRGTLEARTYSEYVTGCVCVYKERATSFKLTLKEEKFSL